MQIKSDILRRVWIVSELYYPEETSTGYIMTEIAEGLAEQFEIGVLCSQPTYASRGQRSLSNETRNGVHIHRCWSTTLNKDVLPFRLVNMMTITLSIFLTCLHCFRSGDIVIVVTNPPLLPFAVLLASRFCRSKCCLLVHDVYPEALVAYGIAKPNSLIVRGIGWLTKRLYKKMARIIVLGRDMDFMIRKKTGIIDQRIQIVPNWADTDFIKPSTCQGHPLLAKLGLSEKFIIQYSGNIGRTHGIEQIVACAEILKNDPLIHFLFIGFGGKKLWLEQHVRARECSNITIMDYQPRTELPVSLTACDVAIISFVRGMMGVSVPSRMYNVMAAGKPIIAVAEPNSELAIVVSEEDIGWVVSPCDIDGLRMAILQAKSNPNLLVQMGRRAREASESKYSFDRVKKSYAKMITSI